MTGDRPSGPPRPLGRVGATHTVERNATPADGADGADTAENEEQT